MVDFRTAFTSPWRAVSVLGVTQIIAWGALFYPPVLTLPLIAAERGWSITFAMAGFSAGLLVGGLVSPTVGRLIDRYGGHMVMAGGSLAGALGLVLLVNVTHHISYFATWMLLGAAMASNLYDSAFATLGRIFGAGARRPITLLTFAGGFASTFSWPTTLALIDLAGWRGAYLVFAALLAFVAAPLHFFSLPRERADPKLPAPGVHADPAKLLPASGMTFFVVAVAFASFAFIPSALSAHMLTIFGRGGIDTATAVAIGALFGPSQVAARFTEFLFAGNLHPLNIARLAIGAVLAALVMLVSFDVSIASAFVFVVIVGAANGLMTIARGTVPLYLFGALGYGRVVGRIARPALIMQSVAPVVMALVVERGSDRAALALMALFAAVSLVSFLGVRRPV
jgi:MFS family permease